MSIVATCFADVPDPRTGNALRHEFLEVLTIALTASVCGAETCVDFADFAVDREALFRSFLTLEHGLPSHDTFSRLFRLIEPAQFNTAFSAFPDQLGARGAGVLAIDGKTLRRSFDKAAGGSALHVVSAFASDRRLVLGQAAVANGANEIIAARELLMLLDLTGMPVTGDAIHCQSDTCTLMAEKGGDWLFALKADRPAMHAAVEAFLADPDKDIGAAHVTTDGDHGRLEIRRHWVSSNVDWLFSDRRCKNEPRLPGRKTLALVEAEVTRDGKTSLSRRNYASSAALTAQAFADAARAHWSIGNSLHYVLDTTSDEDRARARKDHGPENLAILQKPALNLIQNARKDISIRRKRKRSGWSGDFARTILGQMR
jgi:predicted transposase YbfD/YdcC